MGTISPGTLLKESASTISLHGNIEYYIADNISVRGDSYYFLQAKKQGTYYPFDFNHSTFAGASYHFKTKNHFDPYLYIEPGISLTRTSLIFTDDVGNIYYPKGVVTVNPLFSSGIGFNLYFERYFHVFWETRYIIGKYLSDMPQPQSLNELRFSFGLGFNLSVFKPK